MDTGWADMGNQQGNRQGDRETDRLTWGGGRVTVEAWQRDRGGDRATG